MDEEDQLTTRKQIQDFVKLHRFLSQLITFQDVDLEKWFVFLAHFVRLIPKERSSLPVEVTDEVELSNYKVQKAFTTSLVMEGMEGEMYGQTATGDSSDQEEEKELLSKIVKTLNDAYGGIFDEEEIQEVVKMEEEIMKDDHLMQYFNSANSKENIKAKFDEAVDDRMLQFVNKKLGLYNKLTNDQTNSDIKRIWFNAIYDQRIRGINL